MTHLNLRAEPLVDSDLVAEIPEGEAVVVVNAVGAAAGPCGGSEGCSVTFDTLLPGERWWLHVRTAAGLEGWAASDFLDWAESPRATPWALSLSWRASGLHYRVRHSRRCCEGGVALGDAVGAPVALGDAVGAVALVACIGLALPSAALSPVL